MLSANIRMAISHFFLLLGLVVAIPWISSGCARSQVIWSAEARSPDGTRVATARTVAQSGFGTDFIGTTVYLNWTKGTQSPREILILSNGTVEPGATNVEMKWLTPTHLELTYVGSRDLDFQAAKYAGVDISVREAPSRAPDNSRGQMPSK